LATATEQLEGLAALPAVSQHDVDLADLTVLSAATLLVVESQQQPSPQQTGSQQQASQQAEPQQQVSPQQHAVAAFTTFDFTAALAPTPITAARVNAPTTPSI